MRLIDADALMDTIESTTWYHINRCGELVSGANSKEDTPLYKADDIYKAISEAPTIDAVSEWIPCEERLPSEDGKYLIVGRQGAVNILPYRDGRWYGRWGVIAWMPLPKPYGEREGE